jgi:hypothetical protein
MGCWLSFPRSQVIKHLIQGFPIDFRITLFSDSDNASGFCRIVSGSCPGLREYGNINSPHYIGHRGFWSNAGGLIALVVLASKSARIRA